MKFWKSWFLLTPLITRLEMYLHQLGRSPQCLDKSLKNKTTRVVVMGNKSISKCQMGHGWSPQAWALPAMMTPQRHCNTLRITKGRMPVQTAAILPLTSSALTDRGGGKAIETLQSQGLSMSWGQGMLVNTRSSKTNNIQLLHSISQTWIKNNSSESGS